MKFRWLQTILAILVGTGWAMAQGQGSSGTVPTPGSPTVVSTVPAADYDGACGDAGMNLPDDGHPLYTFFAYGQMLFWNVRDPNLPIQVNNVPVGFATVTPAGGGVPTAVPVTIQANPTIPGANEIDTSNHLGTRVGFGIWFGDSQRWGLELSGFDLEEKSQAFRLNNAANPQTLGISTVIMPAGTTTSTTVVFPRQSVVAINGLFSTNMWGTEANILRKGWYYGPLLLTYITGLRYQEFEEQASLISSATLTTPAGVADPAIATFPSPLTFASFDRINARNQFFGAQVGVEADMVLGAFFFNARAKVAVGDVRQQISILGSSQFIGTAAPLPAGGGLLSGPGDQGTYERDRVAFWPEVNLKVGYQLCDALRIYVGYDALYMQHVARPGGQTDLAALNTQITVANTNATFNVLQPVVRLKDMDVWVQGLNAGLEFRY